ncbi:nucleoside-diphosphate sugar epimerase/dehydratase [Novacetimonas hansenii]|uniref:polysaccharide biosynthesis protein n=1 Tax=Novacetimonas hansenii TaxID=436 RepID=UPI00248E2E7F|nr:nucleoside-diphosphate sugar epimerase/dehydratase [Novacetimonas hansenii]
MVVQSLRPDALVHRLLTVRAIVVNVVLDFCIGACAVPCAQWLDRPGVGMASWGWHTMLSGGIALLAAGLPFRIAQQHWRFSGAADFWRLAWAAALAALFHATAMALVGHGTGAPAFPVIHALVLLVMLVGSRLTYQRWRLWRQQRRARAGQVGQCRVVLVADGRSADLFMHAASSAMAVAGMVVNGAHRRGRRIHGVPVLGTVDELDAVLARLCQGGHVPSPMLIVDPRCTGAALAAVLRTAQAHGVQVRRMPDIAAITAPEWSELYPVEIEELLNRPPVTPDFGRLAGMLQGRRVLVTGAGGSIGTELVRQIARYAPSSLILLDNGEYALWRIDVDLSEQAPRVERHIVIADVRDPRRIEQVFAQYRPELVFHAAALKHVPMVEDNPCEGLLTNIEGSRVVADAARRHGARAMVQISTDKAVNPSSIMGASKRVAEMYCQALDIMARRDATDMRCITVRFGNVLGSAGSVVSLFRHQIERGGPLTITDPDMERYFMTVAEAVALVLQASACGLDSRPGEGEIDDMLRMGGIFVLDMGQPVRIVDLAHQMIVLAGLRPGQDIDIRFTGARRGEKLSEDLFHQREVPRPTGYRGLRMATPRTVDLALATSIMDAIVRACREGDDCTALALLKELVPEFVHMGHHGAPMASARQTDCERNAS